MKRKIYFFVLLIISFVIIIFLILYKNFSSRELKELKVANTKIFVEVKKTPKERQKGLSGRKNLPENQGMLFVFEKPGYYAFWMKDMNFALDFIWIKDNKIVEITKNVKPEDYQPPKTLIPQNEVDMVLEVNAGFVKKNNIKVGDIIEYF